ncbi:unnamed protein product, partial [Prorocentrum cordatum]
SSSGRPCACAGGGGGAARAAADGSCRGGDRPARRRRRRGCQAEAARVRAGADAAVARGAAGATHGPFAHMGPLEHSLVVAMFCTLSVCLAFAALYGCLNPDACGAERARRVGFEQEAAELRDEIARLSQ